MPSLAAGGSTREPKGQPIVSKYESIPPYTESQAERNFSAPFRGRMLYSMMSGISAAEIVLLVPRLSSDPYHWLSTIKNPELPLSDHFRPEQIMPVRSPSIPPEDALMNRNRSGASWRCPEVVLKPVPGRRLERVLWIRQALGKEKESGSS